MFILFSLGHLFTIMLNFCIKSLHSFLAYTKDKNGTLIDQTPLQGRRNFPSPASGLGYVTFSDNTIEPANVVDSAAIKPPSPVTLTAEASTVVKKDPGGIGFLDEVGGSIDGLMSCTEGLGFESCDERRVDDEMMDRIANDERGLRRVSVPKNKWKRKSGRRSEEVRKFPPLLSSLNNDGKPNFFLRPVRKNGRLELTEVKINRMEVLHASRQDGRLSLHLIRDVDVDEQFEDQEKEEEAIGDNILEEEEENIRDTIEEEKIGEKWVFPVANGSGDGFRRCHEVVSHHNLHHNLRAWGQHCLTIR